MPRSRRDAYGRSMGYALIKNGVWYTYGWDLTKNICELYGQEGFIRTIYTYSPYGQVRENGIIPQSARRLAGRLDKSGAFAPKGENCRRLEGRLAKSDRFCPSGVRSREATPQATADGAAVSQPIQWSSEVYDAELRLVYYNFRYYNPTDGRWTRRDPVGEEMGNLYCYIDNDIIEDTDYLGLIIDTIWDVGNVLWDIGVIVRGFATGDQDMIKDGATDLAIDALAAVIPGLPAGASKIARAGKISKRMKGKRGKPKKMSKRCQELRAAKQAAMAAAKRMACKGTVPKCPTVSICETYRFRASLFQTERIARETYDRECFEGGDGGHITQRENKGRAEENCMQKYAQCMARAKK